VNSTNPPYTLYTVIQVTALTEVHTRPQTDYKSRFTIFVLKADHDSFMLQKKKTNTKLRMEGGR